MSGPLDRLARPLVANMSGTKRGADDITGISDVRKRSSDTTESLISGESGQGVCNGLRREVADILSKSVVSLALSNGHGVLFATSGIAIECCSNFTKFLTSASLVRAFKDATAMKDGGRRRDNVKIEVCYEGNVLRGRLEEYDLDHEVAVVSVRSALDICGLGLHLPAEFPLHTEVIAVGRQGSGSLVIRSGRLTVCSWASQTEDSKYLMFSTCEFSKDLHGGGIFDLDARFVGMNLLSDVGGSIFMPRSIILERLEHLRTYPQRRVFFQLLKTVRDKEPATGDKLNSHVTLKKKKKLNSHAEGHKDVLNKIQIGNYKTKIGDLASLGYPRPSLHHIDPGMILVGTFEEPFGDEYPGGVWSEFRERISSNIHRNVVALASFSGETRFFASTGFFIDFDNGCTTILTSASLVRCPTNGRKIVEGLRIEVLLPNKQRREGTLEHYSFYYNVALVCIKNFRAVRPAILRHERINLSCKLVAIGRCYESGALMAASGIIAECRISLDCRALRYSTCKITKAGIGGPLVDVDGNFIGMNFFGQTGQTPFLLCDALCGILQYFKTKNTEYKMQFGGWSRIVEDCEGRPSYWPVRKAHWHVPCDQETLKVESPMEKYERAVRASDLPYRYLAGGIYVLK